MGNVVRFKRRRRRASTYRRPAKRRWVKPVVSLVLIAGALAAVLGYLAIPVAGCRIKGNIAVETGEHIYHMPGQEYYDEAIVRPERGERWFCSQLEALWAGWRRAKV